MMEPLLACVNRGLISKPVFPKLPENFPLRIAISAAKLTDGCAPPTGVLGHRVGIGIAGTVETAAIIAMAEAVERYSLQYSVDMPEIINPYRTLGGEAEQLARRDLVLGAPDAISQVTTRGAASGPDLRTATKHAAYECYEHFVRDQLSEAGGGASQIETGPIESLREIEIYLESRLRRINLLMHTDGPGLVFIACICSDMDGGRPTTGFAVGEELSQVSVKAVREAILQWRNMIELERNSISLDPLSVQDLEIIQAYRGATRLQKWLTTGERSQEPNDLDRVPVEDPLEAIHTATGRRVRLFDMSDPETGICTVRVVLE